MEEGLPYFDSREAIQSYISSLAQGEGVELDNVHLASALDKRDKLASFRSKFHVPTIGELLEGEEIADGVCVHL